jgi:hypothetical protein
MQFNNDITRKVAEEAARIMAEALKGNQHKIDKNKNNKVDAEDFKILRGEKKAPVKEESEEVTEASSKQENKFHKKLDKLVHGTFGKSSDEKMKKEEVEPIDELSKSTLASYAKKASHDARIKMATGKDFERISITSKKPAYKAAASDWEQRYKSDARRREAGVNRAIDKLAKEEVEELDEALWPGTPEYEKKFPKESKPGQRRKTQDYGYQGKEEEHGETTFRKEVKPRKSKYGARQNYVRSRKISGKTLKDDVEVGFTDILEAYDSHGLKFIAAMMKEEPDNEQFTKEVEEQKKRDKGEIRNDKGVAKPLQNASVSQPPVNPVREESEQVEEGVLGSIAAGVGSFIGNKIDPTHGEMLRTHGPEVVRQLRYHATNAVNKVKNKVKKEEVEQVEEKTLTEPETAKKEEIVKSMKKGVKGFKQRYGDRAKSVMYATATKIAKEKA